MRRLMFFGTQHLTTSRVKSLKEWSQRMKQGRFLFWEGIAMYRSIVLIVLIVAFLDETASAAERRYMGVWQKDSGSNLITPPLSFSAFGKKGEDLTEQGLRLIDIESFATTNGRRYVGVWREGKGSNLVFPPLTVGEFRKKRQEMMAKGMRLADFEVLVDKGRRMFLGVWRSGTGAERLIDEGLRFDTFVKLGDQLIEQGLRLLKVDTLHSGKDLLYFGLWQTGTGSNLIVRPLRALDFTAKRKEFTAKSLRMIDLKVVQENGVQMYLSVWSDGPGENHINAPLGFPAFVARGESLVKQGYRLTAVDTIEVPTNAPPKPPGQEPPGSPGGTPVTFAPLPPYIRLSNDARLIVDFSAAIDDPPRITIPTRFLPLLPTNADDTIIFPDNFCGIRVRQASRFVFLKNGKQFDEFPFNNVPESSSVAKMFGDNFYLGGIDFTGPIGACTSTSEDWRFFFPFTQSHEAGGPPDAQVTLVIEMEQGSQIEFLNFLQVKTESLSSYEIFKDHTKEKMKKISELLSLLKIDDGYCSIDNYVRKMCKDAKQDGKPGECLIGEEVTSPCF